MQSRTLLEMVDEVDYRRTCPSDLLKQIAHPRFSVLWVHIARMLFS
jgi:hypothetical protein